MRTHNFTQRRKDAKRAPIFASLRLCVKLLPKPQNALANSLLPGSRAAAAAPETSPPLFVETSFETPQSPHPASCVALCRTGTSQPAPHHLSKASSTARSVSPATSPGPTSLQDSCAQESPRQQTHNGQHQSAAPALS